ncbi:hypothetical protein M595_6054 [Lyngbya aestuarii BL J]|uniref:Uncharacterized protein n=1 Tax=Lyngbya aestuarii BL J TaxID=1348334 RepID=U7QB95_9CYAN|nr:hypothetical protein [Lyngbya aestuarii]ERT04001.1 hypothetical protein M595_6054 [Lyngbya aestuarii BL J]
MRKKAVTFLSAVGLILMNFGFLAKADTVKVRCDFYPKGEDKASASEVCTFSQRQGFVSIQRENGTRYEFSPVGDQPGNFENESGEAVYRQSGLGERGLIFRMPRESVYIYWDTAPFEADKSESNSTAYPQQPIQLFKIAMKLPSNTTTNIISVQ